MRHHQRVLLAGLAVIAAGWALEEVVPTATAVAADAPSGTIAPGLIMPTMDPVAGKKLFASKGCVVCHSINGVGGTDAPALDASTMQPMMNPFDFFAKMWRGAMPMVAMQENELGHQIEFTGKDLADIVAFAHNASVQKTFTEADIPPEIRKLMSDDEGESRSGRGSGQGMMQNGQGGMMGNGQMMGGQHGGMMGARPNNN